MQKKPVLPLNDQPTRIDGDVGAALRSDLTPLTALQMPEHVGVKVLEREPWGEPSWSELTVPKGKVEQGTTGLPSSLSVHQGFPVGSDRAGVSPLEPLLTPALLPWSDPGVAEAPASESGRTTDYLSDQALEVGEGERGPAGGDDPYILLPARYRALKRLGQGGMGEVYQVCDLLFDRLLAMKVLRAGLRQQPELATRFYEEAKATAKLQHPGIVPVYDVGRLSDGRYFFTMKEVRGRTFRTIVREVHAASTLEQWGSVPGAEGETSWTFRRLLDVFHAVCETVAYAHAQGVLHRDLKPSNVMVGPYGEVLVMDWGLLKVMEQGAEVDELHVAGSAHRIPFMTENGGRSDTGTPHPHQIVGTPAYMSPEQAQGELGRLGPATDVYALGAMLYEILSGRPPYLGADARAVLQQVIDGPPIPVRHRLRPIRPHDSITIPVAETPLFSEAPLCMEGLEVDLKIPDELAEICDHAMARHPNDRFADARALARAVADWLDGAQRRERAAQVLEAVKPKLSEREALLRRASELREAARELLRDVKPSDVVERKLPGWQVEDQAEQLEQEAALKSLEYVQGLRGALTHAADLSEAHERLAEHYHRQHQEAEARRAPGIATQCEVLLRAYDRRGAFATYIQGDGAVSLFTDPPGAEVELYRYDVKERRLVPRYERHLGRTPLRALPLAKGSYLLLIRAPGYQEVRYPVQIGRLQHWAGIPPGAHEPLPIRLPREKELGPEDVYIPAGWFWCGGDDEARHSLPRQDVWVDGLVVRRFPVRNREYLPFLNALLLQGREEEALRWSPRERAGGYGEQGGLSYSRNREGLFVAHGQRAQEVWLLEVPVVQLDWWSSQAYVAWEAANSGLSWRLPSEVEWEKAARGVDGRWYPWGDTCDPSWVCIRESHAGRPRAVVADSYPIDESVYGVRGLGGNVQSWCQEVFTPEGPLIQDGRTIPPLEDNSTASLRVNRGGVWFGSSRYARCTDRIGLAPAFSFGALGVRLVRSF